MEQRFKPGDFLFFQLEAGFALIRLLAITEKADGIVWHTSAYHDLFPDTDSIENAVTNADKLSVAIPHVALTNRAFESTQVANIGFAELTDDERNLLERWNADQTEISDRSIRLHMGLR